MTICTKDKKCILSRIIADENQEVLTVESVQTVGGRQKYTDWLPNDNDRTNEIIPHVVGALKRFTNAEIGENIFQRSYYDHVTRNAKDIRKLSNIFCIILAVGI